MSDHPFGPDVIARAVHMTLDEAFATIPEGKHTAVLVIADESGARAVFATRIGDHWQLAANGGVDWQGRVHGAVAVKASW